MAGEKEFLRVSINLPAFQIELTTADPSHTLPELRKILDRLQVDDDVVYEEFVTEELKIIFSEAFMQNQQVMGSVRKLLRQEEDYRASMAEIPCETAIDLQNASRAVHVSRKEVQHAVAQLTRAVESRAVKHGIVHINGDLERESKLLIVDHIHKYMPTAQLRAYHSKGEQGKVVVECIFFGDFPEDEE